MFFTKQAVLFNYEFTRNSNPPFPKTLTQTMATTNHAETIEIFVVLHGSKKGRCYTLCTCLNQVSIITAKLLHPSLKSILTKCVITEIRL